MFLFNFFLLSLWGLAVHPFLPFQNPKPRNLLFVGLTTFVLLAFTLRNSFLSSQLTTDFITLFAAFSLFTNRFTSSAYLTNSLPLFSISLSNWSSNILDNIGLMGPPCG